MGIASLVVSIIAIILSIIPVVGLPMALIALILAIVAMCRKKNREVYRGLKIAGLVISIIAMVISTLMTAPVIIGAYIIAENNEEIVNNAQNAIADSDLANIRNACMLAWADAVAGNDGVARQDGEVVTAEHYYDYLAANGFGTKSELKQKYIITVNESNGTPKIKLNK